MFILKKNKYDDGMGFLDVHALMKYFKNQVYHDWQKATTELDSDAIAVFSQIFLERSEKRTFKNISSGPFGYKAMLKKMFDGKSKSWRYKHFQSIPTNYKRLYEWVDNGNGYLEQKEWKWEHFWKYYYSKDDPILSKEEMIYGLE